MLSRLKPFVTEKAEGLVGFLPVRNPFIYTGLGALLGILAAVEIYRGKFLEGAIFLAFSGLMDALDGLVARVFNRKTEFGWFLDSFLDRVVEGVVYFALARHYCLLSIAALITSYLVSYARAKVDALAVGIAERAERLLLLILGLLTGHIKQALIAITVLAGITALQRAIKAKEILSAKS